MIPTLSKAKISRHLSYPIGAEQVSAAGIIFGSFVYPG
jgi:hypothetical protein